MPSRVERRVGQHGNADKLYSIQNAVRGIAAAASASGFTRLINMKAQFVNFIAAHGNDRAVGANQSAHAAAYAGMRDVGALDNAVIHGKQISRFFFQADGDMQNTFAMHAQFNRTHRTHRGAVTAKGALVLAPVNLPGQILDAQC